MGICSHHSNLTDSLQGTDNIVVGKAEKVHYLALMNMFSF